MTLGDLIARLEKEDRSLVLRPAFGAAHSWRGDYSELAFTPQDEATVGEMLLTAKSALGRTFHGYKGGEFVMHEHTDCYIAEYGEYGGNDDALTSRWLDMVIAAAKEREP